MVWGFVCRPSSVIRLCRNYRRIYLADLFQSSVVACPRPYAQTVLSFKKSVFQFFTNFFPFKTKTFKTLLINQIAFEFFRMFVEFSWHWPSQKYCFGFLKFWFAIFHNFFFDFVTMEENFETLIPPQIVFEFIKFLRIFFSVHVTKEVLDFVFFLYYDFSWLFFGNFTSTTLCRMRNSKLLLCRKIRSLNKS